MTNAAAHGDDDDDAREIQVFQDLQGPLVHLVPVVDQKKKYNVDLKVMKVIEGWKENLAWWAFLDQKDTQWVVNIYYYFSG